MSTEGLVHDYRDYVYPVFVTRGRRWHIEVPYVGTRSTILKRWVEITTKELISDTIGVPAKTVKVNVTWPEGLGRQ
jgi:hypothetical protein